jgi:phage terminase large subunit GpA-like protein
MSTNTDKTSTHDLLIRAYCDGQNAFKSDAAIAITIADAARLGATGSAGTGATGYVIKAGVVAVFTLPATGNAVKDTSVSATGL